MTDGLKDEHREAIIAAIAANDHVERAVLFGSRATGTNTVSSDVDIALFGDRLTLTDQGRLAAALDEIPMVQETYLVLYDSLRDHALREQIQRDGVEWYVRPVHGEAGRGTSMAARTWPIMSLRQAGVSLIDCEHRTPPATDRGYPYVGIPQIKNGRVDLDSARPIAEEHYRDWTRKANPEPFDIVLSRRCNPGETGFVSPELGEFAVGKNLVLLRSDGEKISKPFLRWLSRGPEWWAEVRKYMNAGAVFDSLTCADIPEFRLPIPPLSEQRSIAHVLGTLDDKMELNRRMNTTAEAMARALFKSWFIDFDPVRAKMEGRDTKLPKHIADLFPTSLSESGFRTTPRGWTTYRLDEIADHHTKSTTPSAFPESEFEHYSIPAYDTGQTPAIEPGVAIKSNKIVAPLDAVLLSKLNPETVRVWAPRHPHYHTQVCSTEFLVFTPRDPGNRALLYFLFIDERFRTMMQSMVTGTSKSHQRVPPRALRESAVVCGTPEVFEMFHQMVGPMLREMIERRAESFTLAAVRDALLPKLVAGEIRATTR